MAGKTVMVCGANGFIATWIVKLLLELGYTVRGTVRDPGNVEKVQHLFQLPGAKEKLTLQKADLVKEGEFDNIMDGVDGVFHTASPCTIRPVLDVEEDLIIPSVKGTLNVLAAAAKQKSVKRVILTSSIGAVNYTQDAWASSNPATLIDENWWSDEDWCRNNQFYYALSKTQAERAAWDSVKDKDIELIVLNPGLMIGPILQNTLNASSEILLQLLYGTTHAYKNREVTIVHVKDVACAHILLFATPQAQGRYILAGHTTDTIRLLETARVVCPDCIVTTKCIDDSRPTGLRVSSEKIQKLGLEFAALEETLKDCIVSLTEKKWVKQSSVS